jgi:hypothetical protein
VLPTPPVIQTKLKVGASDDKFEQEADRVAGKVMRLPHGARPAFDSYSELSESPGMATAAVQRRCTACAEEEDLRPKIIGPTTVQRLCAECEAENERKLRGKPLAPEPRVERVQPDAPASAAELTTGGAPLSHSLRAFYESRLGYHLGHVRVHTGAHAEHLSNSLQAHAFTYDSHIWLGAGQTLTPSFCLAHELVHVIQQSRPPRMAHRPARAVAEPPRTQTQEPLVQRLAVYWIPAQHQRMKSPGKSIEKALWGDAKRARGLMTQVAIPHGARKKRAQGSEAILEVGFGLADLYLAEGNKPIGVHFPAAIPTPLKGMKKVVPFKARPQVNDKGEITQIEEGPTWVRVGEIKPASREQINLGKEQVKSYLEGINLTVRLTNVWANAKKKNPWPLSPAKVQPLNANEFVLPASYTYIPSKPRTDTELVLAEFDPNQNLAPKVLINPLPHLGQPVLGGFYAHPYEGGVWGYFSVPADPQAVIQQRRLTREAEAAIHLAQRLQDEVVDPISGAPVEPKTMRRRGAQAPGAITHLPARGRIQRQPKGPPRVRETFDQNKLKDVKKARDKLRTELEGKEATKPFQVVRFVELAYQAEESLELPPGSAGVKRLPEKDKLKVTLGSKPGTKGSKKVELSLPTLHRWLKVWTNPAIDLLADFRYFFGSTFATVTNKVALFANKAKEKLKEVFGDHAGSRASGTSYTAVALRAIGRGLLKLAEFIIPPILRMVVNSLIDGLKHKWFNMIPQDLESLEQALTQRFSGVMAPIEKLKNLKDTIDAKIEEVKEALGEYWNGIKKVIEVAEEIATLVKWTARLIQCGSPPVWGCLKLLFSSLTAWLVEKVLDSCWLQRKVACALSTVDFVRVGLPTKLAGAIRDKLNDFVTDIAPGLSPLFDEIKYEPPVRCEEIGCDESIIALDLAYSNLMETLEKRYGTSGAARMMDAFLEISRYSGSGEENQLTADEVNLLTQMLVEHNVDPSEMAMLAEKLKARVEAGEKLTPATVKEFIEAIERERMELAGGGTTAPPPTGPTLGGASTGGAGEGGAGEGEGQGEGLPTTDFEKARFDGKPGAYVKRTGYLVENPDMLKHTAKDVHKIDLIGLIYGNPVSRVTDVPAYVPERYWLPNDVVRTEFLIKYELRGGVCFKHSVSGVPTFCFVKGQLLEAHITPAAAAKAPTKGEKK